MSYKQLKNHTLINADYRDVQIPDADLIISDPLFQTTDLGFDNAVEGDSFDEAKKNSQKNPKLGDGVC